MPAPLEPPPTKSERRRSKTYMWALGVVLMLVLALAGYAMLNRARPIGREPPGAHIGRPAGG